MSDAEAPQPKPEGGEQLNIKVKDADGNEVFFKVKRTTKLAKLKKAYAERMGRPENSVRFIFDGQRINDNDTAETVSTIPHPLRDNDQGSLYHIVDNNESGTNFFPSNTLQCTLP